VTFGSFGPRRRRWQLHVWLSPREAERLKDEADERDETRSSV